MKACCDFIQIVRVLCIVFLIFASPCLPPFLFLSANCPPQNVVVDSQCDEGTIVVSWSPNTDAQYFQVAAVSNTRARLYCNSSSTACTIKDLPCGQSYNVTVLSVRDGCESKPSAVVETSSGKPHAETHFFQCNLLAQLSGFRTESRTKLPKWALSRFSTRGSSCPVIFRPKPRL